MLNGIGTHARKGRLISPLLKKEQSLAHIYAYHASEIPCCRKTLYNYIDKSLFSAKDMDIRRRVRYKVQKRPTKDSQELLQKTLDICIYNRDKEISWIVIVIYNDRRDRSIFNYVKLFD